MNRGAPVYRNKGRLTRLEWFAVSLLFVVATAVQSWTYAVVLFR